MVVEKGALSPTIYTEIILMPSNEYLTPTGVDPGTAVRGASPPSPPLPLSFLSLPLSSLPSPLFPSLRSRTP